MAGIRSPIPGVDRARDRLATGRQIEIAAVRADPAAFTDVIEDAEPVERVKAIAVDKNTRTGRSPMGLTLNQRRFNAATCERNGERRSRDPTSDNNDTVFQATPIDTPAWRCAVAEEGVRARPLRAHFPFSSKGACLDLFNILNKSSWINKIRPTLHKTMHLLRRGTTRAGDERYLVPALMRGLQVLQSLSGETRRLSLSELAEAIGVTRSSAYRLVYTLDHLGFLKSDAQTKTYTLGTAGASDRLRLSEVARSRGG